MLKDPMGRAAGQRRRNIIRTRMAIAEIALELFELNGYEGTTLLDVAHSSGVSISTVHRYFPTKDSLLVEHPRLWAGGLAALTRERAVREPFDDALRGAVLDYLALADDGRPFLRRLRNCIDAVPTAIGRVQDHWARERTLLCEAVRELASDERSSYRSELVCGIAVMVVALALDHARRNPDRAARDIGAEILAASMANAWP